jgi:xanthine dehydrogenase accessory factor
MNESERLTEAVRALRAENEPFVVATVVRITGSAYRRPGARMVIARGRHLAGSVSGGCIEADVLQRGFFRTETAPQVVRYDARVDDDVRDGFGIGCDGVVDVLLERGTAHPAATDPFRWLERAVEEQRPFYLATVFASADGSRVGSRAVFDDQGNVLDDARQPELAAALQETVSSLRALPRRRGLSVTLSNTEVLVERLAPPPHLFVFGTGHDVPPLVQLATLAGFTVTVCEQAGRHETRERFHGLARVLSGAPATLAEHLARPACAFAVVMGHHLERDTRALEALIASPVVYIGVLGPRTRTARLLAEARPPLTSDARLFAPAGLRLGGDSPESVAVSLLAEMQAVLARGSHPGSASQTAGTGARHLRDHDGPIHDLDE